MFHRQFDKCTGVYRSSDPIDNFQFKIVLRTINTLIKIPDLETFETFGSSNNTDNKLMDVSETIDLKWQEKRLSKSEILHYANKANCKTDNQKKFNEIIHQHNLDRLDKLQHKIFTLTADDDRIPMVSDEFQNNMLTNLVQLRDDTIDTTTDHRLMSTTVGINRFKGLDDFEIMFIMADLEPDTILFIIKWRSKDGLFIIYPDFNNINVNPYFIEINTDRKHMYYYSIQNTSRVLIKDGRKIDTKLINKLSVMSITSTPKFQMPPKNCTYVCLFYDIKYAEQFEYDNIHIRYKILLPIGCDAIQGNLTGSTHSSFKCHSSGIWTFGYPCELSFLCRDDCDFHHDSINVILEAISIDYWGRERTEGYTHLNILLKTGIVTTKLPCYRDLRDDTIIERLERFFIGGRRKLLIERFNGIPMNNGDTKPTKLNRYGSHTISTGNIFIKYQLLLQAEPTRRTEQERSNTSIEVDKQRFSINNDVNWTIDDVVSAYHVAKHRLQKLLHN